jgi:hypothetical protein
MESSRRLLRASPALVLLAPLLVPLAVPLASLPPGLVFALTSGRWLIVLGAAAAAFALARHPEPLPRHPERSEGSGDSLVLRPKPLFVGTWLCGFSLFLALVPSHRWSGASLTGDEPKYLRMAESLYHDLDVDVGSETQQDLDAHRLRRNVTSFLRATGNAVAGLFAGNESDQARSSGHNWTIEGRQGGKYYVQSPGLPTVLLPAVALQSALSPRSTGPWLPMVTLAALWATALAHTVRLCTEVVASSPTALLAAITVLSPPVLIGGMHFYPESMAIAVLAWALRYVRPGGPTLGRGRATALATAVGALPWLHPKLIPVALVLTLLLLARLKQDRKTLLAALTAALLPILALLLFDHHVTGLLRPDAFYVVYASEVYAGLGALFSMRLVTGFVNAFFAARDGLFVMAPASIAGVLAIPLLWRRDRRTALVLAAVFAALWFVAAVHEGGAPGPPARLMSPAVPLLAVPLAVGLQEWRRHLPSRWTFAALALITLSMTWSFRTDWLRNTNPYRSLPAEANFAPDLPDGPRDLVASPPEARRLHDLLRGLLLGAVLAGWSIVLTGRAQDPSLPTGPSSPWPQIRNTHLAWWSTLALLSLCLHSLGP